MADLGWIRIGRKKAQKAQRVSSIRSYVAGRANVRSLAYVEERAFVPLRGRNVSTNRHRKIDPSSLCFAEACKVRVPLSGIATRFEQQ